MARAVHQIPTVKHRSTRDSSAGNKCGSTKADFPNVNDSGVFRDITFCNTARGMSEEYACRTERRVFVALGVLVGFGFLLAAIIWWQLLS